MQQSPQQRDRGLRRLRHGRQAVLVLAVAGSLGLSALAARAFPGRARSARPVAHAPAPRATARSARPAHRRHHRHHRRPHRADPAPAPAPPVVTEQPPVVSSGGS